MARISAGNAGAITNITGEPSEYISKGGSIYGILFVGASIVHLGQFTVCFYILIYIFSVFHYSIVFCSSFLLFVNFFLPKLEDAKSGDGKEFDGG